MKKLSDYQGEEAIELWADLMDPFVEIVGDKKIGAMLRAKQPPLLTAKEIIKTYRKQALQIVLRIDPTPVNGLNLIVRLIEVMMEVGNDPTIQLFFGSAAEAKKEGTSSGSATENTEGSES